MEQRVVFVVGLDLLLLAGACGPASVDSGSGRSTGTTTGTSASTSDTVTTDGTSTTGGSTTSASSPGGLTTSASSTGGGSTDPTGPQPPSLHPCDTLDQTACLANAECLWIAPQTGSWVGVEGCVKPCYGLDEATCRTTPACYNRLVNAATGELICDPDCWLRDQANCEADVRCLWTRYEQDDVWYECDPRTGICPDGC